MTSNRTRNFKQYDYISRYESFPYFYDDFNNRYYYGLTANLQSDTPYAAYEVQSGDTYDSISYDMYGSSLYYWAICYFNNIFNCIESPKPGSILKIPSINSVAFKE